MRLPLGDHLQFFRERIGMLMAPVAVLTTSAVVLRDLGDELVDKDVHVAGRLFHPKQQLVVTKQRGNRDRQTGDGGRQSGGNTRCDCVDVDVALGRDRGKGDHHSDYRA